MEFQVLIHGKDVIEDVLSDTGDDAHLVRVMELALQRQSGSHLFFRQQQLKRRLFSINVSTLRLPVLCYLHGVSLPGGGLSICENGAIVATQNI